MPNALIFSPCLDGHRQVYVFVIAHVLSEAGYDIFVAGNLQEEITNSFYVDELRQWPKVTLIDTASYARGGIDISTAEFLQIQQTCNTDLTIFTEADFHFPLFIAQLFNKRSKLKGKVMGIFMRPFFFYKKLSFLDKLRYLKQLPFHWTSDERLFFRFFSKRFKLLDVYFSIDENYVRSHKHFKWLPDVFQQFADSVLSPKERSADRVWMRKLDVFLNETSGKFVFLYFGTAQLGRGYDTLLELAYDTDSSFVHCGLKDQSLQYEYDTERIISDLRERGCYFETNQFLEDPMTIEYFFRSVPYMVLPYKDFLGSSGVMLQALQFGKPVLGPDEAIIGYRIKRNRLGMTFECSGLDSIKNAFEQLIALDPETFRKDIDNYMNLQSPMQLKRALMNEFCESPETVILP